MPPSALPDELLEEIFLRLPPDEPACLVRASLASKLWLGLTGPRFSARYREFHGAPPMLGFCPMDSYPLEEKHFCPMDQEDRVKRYFSTTKFGARIPEDWGTCAYSVHDCRHGRVLLDNGPYEASMALVVWDPMTGCWREMHTPKEDYQNHAAAVLCAVAGCDHRGCHEGPSMVVSIGMEKSEDGFYYEDFFARTWSSETGEWTEPCYGPPLPSYALIEQKPPVLIKEALYFMIHYPAENQTEFLIYDLGSSTLSVLDAPPLPGSVFYDSDYIHMAMEDGTLGFAHVDKLALYLWSRQTGTDAFAFVEPPWTQLRVIHLEQFLPIQNPSEPIGLFGSVEGSDIIFVATDLDVYEIDLKSLQWKKLCKRDKFCALIPYMSFYHPTERVSSCSAAR